MIPPNYFLYQYKEYNILSPIPFSMIKLNHIKMPDNLKVTHDCKCNLTLSSHFPLMVIFFFC